MFFTKIFATEEVFFKQLLNVCLLMLPKTFVSKANKKIKQKIAGKPFINCYQKTSKFVLDLVFVHMQKKYFLNGKNN